MFPLTALADVFFVCVCVMMTLCFKGRYVYENFGADTAEGYGYSSEAQPLYSWGALAGFIGLQANGFYAPQ